MIIPNFIKKIIKKNIYNIKVPKIIWGYRDSTGQWRDKTRVSDTVYFEHPDRIRIENNVYVGHYCILDGSGWLTIEEGCQVGHSVHILTHSSHIAIRLLGSHYTDIGDGEKVGFVAEPVWIKKYSFIGIRATILMGVTIGQGAVIGAGSLVISDVDDYQIVAGVPAKVIGDTREVDKVFFDNRTIELWYQEWANHQKSPE